LTKFTVVAFKQNEKKSVLYKTAKNPSAASDLVLHALSELDADIISLRRIREEVIVE